MATLYTGSAVDVLKVSGLRVGVYPPEHFSFLTGCMHILIKEDPFAKISTVQISLLNCAIYVWTKATKRKDKNLQFKEKRSITSTEFPYFNYHMHVKRQNKIHIATVAKWLGYCGPDRVLQV